MKLADFQKWLDSFLNFEKTQTKGIFWLENMKYICSLLGNPQDSIPCIHVAGSKGKGSVSCMLANIIRENGYKCGIYSSPHITDFRERITSADGFFSDEIYEKSADQLVNCISSIDQKDLPGNRTITWFELVTIFAFLCFKNAKMDYVVYEVGLGGRLDSTNIIKPLLSILMPIELEHTEFLGNTIEQIASEKAGIIKENTPCLISRQIYNAAEKVFILTAEEKKSKYFLTDDMISNFSVSYNETENLRCSFIIKKTNLLVDTNLKLNGIIQGQNASTAAVAATLLFEDISAKTIINGLANAYLPGRFEIRGNIILDGAHTISSISNTISTLKTMYPQKKLNAIFACAGDKDIDDIIPLFADSFEHLIFVNSKKVRNCNTELMYQTAKKNNIKAEIIDSPEDALNTLKSYLKNDDKILITGSFYLVSEILELL